MFSTLDRYIIRKYLGTFFYALILFLCISVVVDITEKINDFLDCSASFKQIVIYYLTWVPYMGGILAPLFVFISVIFFTSKLAGNSEVIAMLSSGMSFSRLLRPYLIVAAFLSVLFWFANNYFIPYTNKKKVDFELTYLKNKKQFNDRNFHFKVKENWFAYLEDYSIYERTGYKFALENIENKTLKYKLRADKIIFDTIQKQWKLYNYYARINTDTSERLITAGHLQQFKINENDSTTRPIDTTQFGYVVDPNNLLSPEFNFVPEDIYSAPETKEALNTKQLQAFVTKEKGRGIGGEDVKAYEIEIYDRTNIALSAFILTLIGVALSSRKMRGGMGLHIGMGLAICSLYILCSRFSQMFSIKGTLTPLVASCLPNVLFAIVAMVFVSKAPK
jgi:lipopolysaccharide export system permease protein